MDSIIFGEIRADDPEQYVRSTLVNWWEGQRKGAPDDDQIAVATAQVLSGLGDPAPTLVSEDDWPSTSPEDDAGHRARAACLIHALRAGLPRVDGESAPDYTISYLAAAVGDHAAGAAACLRRTDQADLYVLPKGWSVAGNRLDFDAPPTPPAAPDLDATTTLLAAGTSPLGDLALAFGKGLLGAIGGQIGAAIFGALIPSSPPSWIDQVYTQIDKLMKTNLDNNTINQLDGQMTGLQTWVTNQYDSDKQSGNYTKQDLTNRLQPYVDDLAIKVLGPLAQKGFRDPGLTVFMIAAGFHLALLQELALLDPKVTDPKKSANAIAITKYAATYAGQAKTAFDEIIAHRKSFIKVRYNPEVICVAANCHSKDAYDFYDSYANHFGTLHENYLDKNKNTVSGQPAAQHDCDVWTASIVKKLTDDLHDPMATAAEWKKLIANPMP